MRRKAHLCDGSALRTILAKQKKEQFSNSVEGPANFIACRAPLLSSNGKPCSEIPLLAEDDGFCSTRDDVQNCPVDSNSNNLCEQTINSDTKQKRLCPCKRNDKLNACNLADAEDAEGSKDEENENGNQKDEAGISQETASSGSSFRHSSKFSMVPCMSISIVVLSILLGGSDVDFRRNGKWNILIAGILFSLVFIDVVKAHNWINNPPSRIKGLTKVAPCPPRPGQSVNFAVYKDTEFHLEWATGHPGSYVYIAFIARENENKLGLNTMDAMDKYVAEAPESAKTWLTGKKYDKTHVRWSGGPVGERSGGPLPTADGVLYAKKLTASDSTFFTRPSEWRCSRGKPGPTPAGCASAGITYGQYEYVPSAIATDVKVAYSNPKYPWLLAVGKYKIVKRRPQDYDLARFKFPSSATPGEYVIQYSWRGYYDCFDVVLAEGSGGGGGGGGSGGGGGGGGGTTGPELVEENVWVKTDHCQYPDENVILDDIKKKDRKCHIVPSSNDISECRDWCENLGTTRCSALNVIPVKNPTNVVSFLKNDLNIQYDNKKCKKSKVDEASNDAFVCYGLKPPAEEPDVGTLYTISDDPADPVFTARATRYKK